MAEQTDASIPQSYHFIVTTDSVSVGDSRRLDTFHCPYYSYADSTRKRNCYLSSLTAPGICAESP